MAWRLYLQAINFFLLFHILFGVVKKKTKNNISNNIPKNIPVDLVIFHKSVKIPNCDLCKAKLQITRMGTFAGLHYRE